MYKYKVHVTRIVDGDTVDVDIDLGFGMIYKKQRVRMMGIDTPESRTRDLEEKFYGLQSKAFLKNLLTGSKRYRDIYLVSHDKGKFGRILGEIFIADPYTLDEGLMNNAAGNVNQMMIDNHHAVPYLGQSKDDTKQGHMWNRAALNEKGIKYIK
jgi:micrococcal nuclease